MQSFAPEIPFGSHDFPVWTDEVREIRTVPTPVIWPIQSILAMGVQLHLLVMMTSPLFKAPLWILPFITAVLMVPLGLLIAREPRRRLREARRERRVRLDRATGTVTVIMNGSEKERWVLDPYTNLRLQSIAILNRALPKITVYTIGHDYHWEIILTRGFRQMRLFYTTQTRNSPPDGGAVTALAKELSEWLDIPLQLPPE